MSTTHRDRGRTPDPEPGDWYRPPYPYDHLLGVRAYSPIVGYGWLCYFQVSREDEIEFWFIADFAPPPSRFLFVPDERDKRSVLVKHDLIMRVEDLRTGGDWLLFLFNNRLDPYLLTPIEETRWHPMPANIRRMINGGE